MAEPKYAIDLISGKLTNRDTSHKWGWAYLRKCQLEDTLGVKIDVLHGESWDDYDVIFLYHGMEQDGETLNLFGGASEDNAKFFERILTYRNKSLLSLDIPMADYGRLCKNRLKNCDDYWRNIDWDEMSKICQGIPQVQDEIVPKVLVGDSHSFSAYRRGYMTFRKDGRTLRGVLRKGIKNEIHEFNRFVFHQDNSKFSEDRISLANTKGLTHLTTYYGNIDIRHHLCREPNPKESLLELLAEYEKQLIGMEIPHIEMVCPLPIEDISRKLPKTGYYKGTPYFGSHAERSDLVQIMIEQLQKITQRNYWKLFTWEPEWYTMDPIEYMTNYMERNRSVHLAPKYHRWNYRENKLNDIKTAPTKIIPLYRPMLNLLEY